MRLVSVPKIKGFIMECTHAVSRIYRTLISLFIRFTYCNRQCRIFTNQCCHFLNEHQQHIWFLAYGRSVYLFYQCFISWLVMCVKLVKFIMTYLRASKPATKVIVYLKEYDMYTIYRRLVVPNIVVVQLANKSNILLIWEPELRPF